MGHAIVQRGQGFGFVTDAKKTTVFNDVTYSIQTAVPGGIPYFQSAPVRVTVSHESNQPDHKPILVCVELLGTAFEVSSQRDDVCFRQIPDLSDGEEWLWAVFPVAQAFGEQELVVAASFMQGDDIEAESFSTRLDIKKSAVDRLPNLAPTAIAVALGALL